MLSTDSRPYFRDTLLAATMNVSTLRLGSWPPHPNTTMNPSGESPQLGAEPPNFGRELVPGDPGESGSQFRRW